MASTFDNEAQVVLSGKIDCGDHIARIVGRDCIDAWPRRPGINPTKRLGEARIVTDVIWVLYVGEKRCSIFRIYGGCVERRIDRNEMTTDRIIQSFPGVVRRPSCVTGASSVNSSRWGGGASGDESQ